MKQIIQNFGIVLVTLFTSANLSAQCPTISCPTDITVSNDAGTCGAVVNYTTPVGTDPCAGIGSGNFLFVCDGDNSTATEIPAELTAAGHTVTTVYNDYAGGNNATLQGSGITNYDAIFWHASGASGYGELHNTATFTNLTNYVNAGGAVFVTGYDVIASPTDTELIAFLGGTSSSDGGSQGTETLVGSNSLTTGVTNTVGLTLNSTGDHDGLNGLQAGTVGVATNGTSHGWTIRTLGAGEIAWVSTANLLGQPWPAWNTPGSGYQEALVNFAFTHQCSPGNVLVVSDIAGATEIAPLLTAAGYNVTSVNNDFVGGNNTVLQGAGLSNYDAIYWHAVGTGSGSTHNAATFTSLNNYVNAGGAVFVHGYDVIASPTDNELITFLGGTSTVDVPGNGGLGTIAGPANSLTSGVTNIVGLTLNNGGDHDALVTLLPGTVGVAPNSSGWDWSLKTLGAGEIAWVSTGQSGTTTFPEWSTVGSGYAEALMNFAYTNANCSGGIGNATTTMIAGLADGSTFPVGVTTVTYEVVDGAGNNPQTCSFTVTVTDGEAPIADVATLADVNAECDATPVAPVATDNCAGTLTGTPDVTFPITTQGTTVVTWTYDDGNGNTSTQTQNVVITDATAPVADVATLADVNAECDATPVAPVATDNCTGTLTGTPDVTFPITTQGTTVVTWTYDDGNGNTSTQTQNVVITDATAPVADVATLADVNETCDAAPAAPVATDNCAGTLTGTPDVTFPITTQGTTVVTWTYDDGNGNTSTQTQNVIISGVEVGVTQNGSTLTSDAAGATYQWLDCDDNFAVLTGETNASFTPVATVGNYAVEVTDNGCVDTSNCFTVDYTGLSELDVLGLSVYPNPNTGNFFVESSNGFLQSIIITDNEGRKVNEINTINELKTSINMVGLSTGIYFVNMIGEFGTITKKIVVQ